MYSLIAENQYGEQLELTNNSAYVITGIDGLNPPDAIINTMTRAGHDGSMFNSAHLDNRILTITIAINQPAEVNRNNLYRFFRTAQKTRLYYSNELHDVYIDGWGQNAPVEYFGEKQIFQATLICPDPYWHAMAESVGIYSYVSSEFEFPFSADLNGIEFSTYDSTGVIEIENRGNVEVGMLIEISTEGTITNPKITNVSTGEFIGITASIDAATKFVINTRTDQKAVYIENVLGVKTNEFSNLMAGSTWLTCLPGMNRFIISGTGTITEMTCIIKVDNLYQGV